VTDKHRSFAAGDGHSDDDLDRYRAENLANWESRVPGHIAPDGYDIAGLINNADQITPVVNYDREFVGDVSNRTLLHAQCHVGTDTLSWAKLGARVTGLDFSPAAIGSARDTAAKMGMDATFVLCDIYDSPNHISEQFDIVYTSVGTICWLPDIDAWARTLAGFVKPGGLFYFRDTHPLALGLDDDRDDGRLVLKYPYFHNPNPIGFDDPTSYSGSGALPPGMAWEWAHPVSSILNAVTNAGLVIERTSEIRHLDWKAFPQMVHENEGTVDERWVLPEDQRDLVPLNFSIRARKPQK